MLGTKSHDCRTRTISRLTLDWPCTPGNSNNQKVLEADDLARPGHVDAAVVKRQIFDKPTTVSVLAVRSIHRCFFFPRNKTGKWRLQTDRLFCKGKPNSPAQALWQFPSKEEDHYMFRTIPREHWNSLNTTIAFYSVIEWSNFAVSVWSMVCQATTLSHFT